MNKTFRWIKNHIRPHFGWNKERGEEIDWKKDNIDELIDKSKDKVEAGITIRFKF